jgi:hypothetical protein
MTPPIKMTTLTIEPYYEKQTRQINGLLLSTDKIVYEIRLRYQAVAKNNFALEKVKGKVVYLSNA